MAEANSFQKWYKKRRPVVAKGENPEACEGKLRNFGKKTPRPQNQSYFVTAKRYRPKAGPGWHRWAPALTAVAGCLDWMVEERRRFQKGGRAPAKHGTTYLADSLGIIELALFSQSD